MPQLQTVFDEVEQGIFQKAGLALDKLERRCKATAVLRLSVFGMETARSLQTLYNSGAATVFEGVRRTFFETWSLMWFLFEVDDGSKLQKWFEAPTTPLLERSNRIRTRLEEWISEEWGTWLRFKDYYDGASSVGVHPTYDSTTNAMAETTARLGYAERKAAQTLEIQRTAAFRDFELQLYFLLSIVVAVFDKAPELSPLNVALPNTKKWLEDWKSENLKAK